MNVSQQIESLRANVEAAQKEFDLAVSFHETWRPTAYDGDLHARMSHCYAGQAFLVIRTALRRELILALTKLWDSDNRAVRMDRVAEYIRNPSVIRGLAARSTSREGWPPELADAIETELTKKATDALVLLDKYLKNGPSRGVHDGLQALRNAVIAHRAVRAGAIDRASLTDEEIETFYQDMSELIRLLMGLALATVYDPRETAGVFGRYASEFWAGTRGEKTAGHPHYRAPTTYRMGRMRFLFAITVALLAAAPACAAAEAPAPADDRAFTLWQRSVLSAFQKARAHEADITKGETEDAPRFPDIDAFMPPQDMRVRLLTSHYAEMDAVSECRQAVLQFRWLAADRSDASSLYDPKIAQEVRDYVGSARRCETDAKLPAIGSRLREVADVIASTPSAPEPPPASLGKPLPLHVASGGKLVDVTLNEVFHQRLKDGIEARTVTVFAHPGDVNGLRSTAAFLARAYLGVCRLDMVRVLVLRDDLSDQLNHPGTWLDVNRIAAADYDPNKRVFSSTFDVEVAKRVQTLDEVAQSEFYDQRSQYHQDQGMTDPDEVDAAATSDVVAKFKLGKDWQLPGGNQTEAIDGSKVELPEGLMDSTAISSALTPTCDRYAAPKD